MPGPVWAARQTREQREEKKRERERERERGREEGREGEIQCKVLASILPAGVWMLIAFWPPTIRLSNQNGKHSRAHTLRFCDCHFIHWVAVSYSFCGNDILRTRRENIYRTTLYYICVYIYKNRSWINIFLYFVFLFVKSIHSSVKLRESDGLKASLYNTGIWYWENSKLVDSTCYEMTKNVLNE